MGSIRMTQVTALILHAVGAGHRYGFDIMDATGLPSGSVYPALRRLERNGYLRSDWEDRQKAQSELRPQRRYYEVSSTGASALTEARQRFHGLDRVLAPSDDAVTRRDEGPGG